VQEPIRRTRAVRLDLRLSERERAALDRLAVARQTTRTAVVADLLLAAAPCERNAPTVVEVTTPGQAAGGAVRVTA
jgi:hypothetical protein